MTDQQKKAIEEAVYKNFQRIYDHSKVLLFELGMKEVISNSEKYGLVPFDYYKQEVKERQAANEDLRAERKENARLRSALQIAHDSLCTYGKHPLIDEQVSKALKGG